MLVRCIHHSAALIGSTVVSPGEVVDVPSHIVGFLDVDKFSEVISQDETVISQSETVISQSETVISQSETVISQSETPSKPEKKRK